jgi:hypothetical protein
MLYHGQIVDEVDAYIKALEPLDTGRLSKTKSKRCTICKITYKEWEDGYYEWGFAPLWDKINDLDPYWEKVADGGWVPGLDYAKDEVREVYIYKNRLPPFVYQRTPPKVRPDVMELMAEAGLDYYSQIEYMIGTRYTCGNDNLIVERDSGDDLPEVVERDTPERIVYKLDRVFL